MAESEGFEPPIALRLCLISSQVHSTGLCQLSCSLSLLQRSWLAKPRRKQAGRKRKRQRLSPLALHHDAFAARNESCFLWLYRSGTSSDLHRRLLPLGGASGYILRL